MNNNHKIDQIIKFFKLLHFSIKFLFINGTIQLVNVKIEIAIIDKMNCFSVFNIGVNVNIHPMVQILYKNSKFFFVLK
jgi:hypothetical protein